MQVVTQLTVMATGKFSDRFGGDDAPYRFVDLYDPETSEVFTVSVDDEVTELPPRYTECECRLRVTKQAKPAVARIRQGERSGQTIDYVAEKLKLRLLALRPVASSQPAGQTKPKAA